MKRLDGIYKQRTRTYHVRVRVVRPFSFLWAKTAGALAIIIIASLNATGLTAISHTLAYYFDIEISSGNAFAAGSLDMNLFIEGWNRPWNAAAFPPGYEVAREVTVLQSTSTIPFQYITESDNLSGDLDFCAVLDVYSDRLVRTEMYQGDLAALATSATTTQSAWRTEYTWPTVSGYENKSCSFDILYKAWQTPHNLPPIDGFHDIETVHNRLDSWGFRINKVYYDVAPGYGTEPESEWVEIYNQTNQTLDLTGWHLCNSVGCDTVPTTTPVVAAGTAFVTGTTTTLSQWNVPGTTPSVIFPDGSIGSGLDNDADVVFLKRPDGFIVDQMNWGSASTSWPNYTSDLWTTGLADAPEGTYYKRSPTGYDTNTPTDWVISDSDIPSPLILEESEEGTTEFSPFSIPEENVATTTEETTPPVGEATSTEEAITESDEDLVENSNPNQNPEGLPPTPPIIELIEKKEEESIVETDEEESDSNSDMESETEHNEDEEEVPEAEETDSTDTPDEPTIEPLNNETEDLPVISLDENTGEEVAEPTEETPESEPEITIEPITEPALPEPPAAPELPTITID